MSRIPAVDPAAATGAVKPLLEGVQKGLGMTPNMFRVAAQAPVVLEGLVALFGAIAKGKLSAKSREGIALAVSEQNGCDYCLSAHTALGTRAGLSAQDLEGARAWKAQDPALSAALRLARAVSEKRGQVTDADLSEARRAGLSDPEILEVVLNVALTVFTNYFNLVAGTEIDFPRVHTSAARPEVQRRA
jgi:uncharacterized peroxidase-related enzyme